MRVAPWMAYVVIPFSSTSNFLPNAHTQDYRRYCSKNVNV